MAHEVFICYSNSDLPRAKVICQHLENQGIRCWIATRDLRGRTMWAEQVLGAIRESSVVLLLLSPESSNSVGIAHDVIYAAKHEIRIVPVTLDPVQLSGPLEYVTAPLHRLDLTGKRFEENLASVVKAVRPPVHAKMSDAGPGGEAAIPPIKGYVFISYSREDHDFVLQLKEILRNRGYAYWDYSESERDYHSALYKELEQKIEKAAGFMSVVTDSWRDSDWPAAEYIYAREAKVPVFIVQAKKLKRPVPIIINQQTRIDMAEDFAKGAVILERELEKKGL